MRLRKRVLAVMLTVGWSILILGTPVLAEQSTPKETEGSHGVHSDMGCCQNKGEQGAGMDCCQKNGTQREGKNCCGTPEGSHGAMHEGRHGEEQPEGAAHRE